MPILTTLGLAAALALPAAAVPTAAATADPAFARCMAGLQATAATQGIAADRFTAITAGLQPDPSVLPLLDAQPEFTTPIWDYLAALVDRQRVDDGRAMLQQHRDLLQRVSTQYGVDPVTIVAVWGVESDYGRVYGKRPLLQSLATLSCAGRRQPFFPRRTAGAGQAHRQGGPAGAGPDRFLGRRLRPHPVHAQHLRTHCR